MKKNLLPIIVLVVVSSIAAYFYVNNTSSTLKPELTDYAVKDTSSITKLFLADKKGNQVLLERVSDKKWMLNNQFVARQDGVNNLLDVIARVQIKTPINKEAYETIVKRLSSSGVKVEIYTDDKKPYKIYYVGGSNQEHTGTEMLLEGSSTPHLTHIPGFYGFLTPRFFTNINEWKNRSIFKYDFGEIAKIKVEFPMDPKESFEITDLGNNQFSLKNLATNTILSNYDTLALLDYVSRFKNIPYESYEETKDEKYKEDILQTKPQQIYTITNKTGAIKKCTTYLKPVKEGATDLEGNTIYFDLDRMYATVNEDDFLVVQYFVFNTINKKLNYFTN